MAKGIKLHVVEAQNVTLARDAQTHERSYLGWCSFGESSRFEKCVDGEHFDPHEVASTKNTGLREIVAGAIYYNLTHV